MQVCIVKTADAESNIGSLTYRPISVIMKDYDGDEIFSGIEEKMKAGRGLSDTNMLNLIFLPLMRNSMRRDELAVSSVKITLTIKEADKRNACIAAAFAFAKKYLNDIKRS